MEVRGGAGGSFKLDFKELFWNRKSAKEKYYDNSSAFEAEHNTFIYSFDPKNWVVWCDKMCIELMRHTTIQHGNFH